MKSLLNIKLFLIIIVLIAAYLRFYQLGSNPPSLTWDEVAWGYNAYSLNIDARDEFGRFLPFDYLESFGDFKPPLYAYLTIIPVKIFGLNEFAVRFPSALFGTLTVLLTYFLTKSIFTINSKNSLKIEKWKLEIPIVSAALLAVSPWHIMLSRAAFEANVATFFIAGGVWLFLESIHSKKWLLTLSVIFFVAAFYTFNTARITGPILLAVLTFAFRKQLLSMKKSVIFALVIGLAMLLPVLPFILSPQARLRFQEVNIFSDIEVIKRTNQEIANDQNAWWSKIIHNRRFAYSVEFVKHYFDNLSQSFLFIKGDSNPKFSTQSLGQLYIFELPFLVAGILFLIRKRERYWWIILFWLLIGIIPAATARETPHALRIESIMPTFQILSAYGAIQLVRLILKIKFYPRLIFTLYSLFILFNIFYFIEDYYTHYPKAYSREWQYGYKDAIAFMEKNEDKYSKIYLTKELGRPYIYTLFYKKYNPLLFRKEADIRRDTFGFVTVTSFNKYYFNKEALKDIGKDTLFIDSPVDVPKNSKVLKRFRTLDGSETMVAYTL